MGRKGRKTAKRTDGRTYIFIIYCHVIECDYRRGFGFIGLFDTARDYTLRFTVTHNS
jgi:hypothetical protein